MPLNGNFAIAWRVLFARSHDDGTTYANFIALNPQIVLFDRLNFQKNRAATPHFVKLPVTKTE